MGKRGLFFFLVMSMCFTFCEIAMGQGRLEGLISDGKIPLAGATIRIGNITRSVLSDEKGFFSVPLPPGRYELQVSYVGYERFVKAISLEGDSIISINIILTPQI